jgi:hypothetical protein
MIVASASLPAVCNGSRGVSDYLRSHGLFADSCHRVKPIRQTRAKLRTGHQPRLYGISHQWLHRPRKRLRSGLGHTGRSARSAGPIVGLARDGGELPSASTGQPSARTDSTPQGASVYVAGKGKYCKENAVSGYLDCFYASLDACEKHNKSANVRCIPNPNSGT